MKPLLAIGVDDEYPALELIQTYCDKSEGITLLNKFNAPEDAILFLKKNDVDLLILDINMPNINGIELLQNVKNNPMCIFITAEEQFAAKAFELDVIDYLIKPISFERFEKAITKAKEYYSFVKMKGVTEDFIMFKSDYIVNKVKLDDISWIEGFGEYIKVVSRYKKHMVLERLIKFEEMYRHLGFIRIHKSYLVLKDHIVSFNSTKVLLKNGSELPVGRAYKENLKFI